MFAWLRRKPSPMTEDKRRVLAALADYPPYDPPRWISKTKPMQEAAAEYTAYFLENRNRRIEALSGFLAKFDVELSMDDEGLKAISEWCPAYLDLLVDGLLPLCAEDDTIWCAYHWLQTPWIDSLIGLNPVFDLGVCMGECLLSRNGRLKWLPVLNSELDKGASHPIFGRRQPFDPIKWTYTECTNVRSAKITSKPYITRFDRIVQAQAMK